PDAEVRARNQAFYEYLVPIVKGFSTESAVEVASLGVQVHGGVGFIEETGAAQHYRDARILPIYEGTTAIQANDFVGRKTLRDGGAVAHACIAAMRDTLRALEAEQADEASGEGLQRLREHFAEAIDAYEEAVVFVLQHAASEVRAVFFGSVPYLMLAGVTHGGWQMARAALASYRRIAEGSNDVFYRNKLGTALFYGAHILPRARALGSAVRAGRVAELSAGLADVA
ncbi:acyl-CoA dehydrogenase, partial [Bordetella avium]